MLGRKELKKIFVFSLSLTMLTACGVTTGGIVPPEKGVNTVKTSVGNLNFAKITDENKALFDSTIGRQSNAVGKVAENASPISGVASGVAAPAAAPMAGGSSAAVSAPDMAIAPGAARMAMPAYFPMPGYFEEYVVINTEEAKSKGFSGTYLETLNQIVRPIITGLGSDARMVSSNGTTDKEGKNPEISEKDKAVGIPYYYQPYQWQYTFVSSSNKEVYSIYVATNETLVIRQKWGLRNLDLDSVKIDSSEAIKIVTKAILDKDFKSPDGSDLNSYINPNEKREVLYEIPTKNSNWYFYLNQENEKLVWNINLNIYENTVYPMPVPMAVPATAEAVASSGSGSSGSTENVVSPEIKPIPEPVGKVINTWVSGGYARIDAKTGEILSLMRPARTTYTYDPNPRPIETPVAPPVEAKPEPQPSQNSGTTSSK